ncbi:MAG TPA: Crp/Fnr family transcriptional regulator [Microscillaceae bacterium]|nr:Crp/Fnr family transcriptional regulator [Microscillaceae bacterium]
MEQIMNVIKQMIRISQAEIDHLLDLCYTTNFERNAILSQPDVIPHEIFFINQGIVRVVVTDSEGTDHTIHFALENQFIADYSSFIQIKPALYTLQTLAPTQVVVMPRKAIEWGYLHLQEGQKLGRLIAEFYFIYQDNRIKNLYARTPKQRYDSITDVFPNIHNRAPQHMIASYLGITPVHLSRLKKTDFRKD